MNENNSINLWMSAIDNEISFLKSLGLKNEVIKKRIRAKFKNRLKLLPFQTKGFFKAYDFVVNNKEVDNFKFCK